MSSVNKEAVMPGKKITIYDVAEAATVSHQTVSRVLKGTGSVAPATRNRIQDAIRTLGYKPNPLARSLASGRSRSILVLDTDRYSLLPLRSLARRAENRGYKVTLSYLEANADKKDFQDSLLSLIDGSVDGALVLKSGMQEDFRNFEDKLTGYPLVIVGHVPKRSTVNAAYIDHAEAARLVFEYLHSLGHRRILELRGPSRHHECNIRHKSFQALCRKSGLSHYRSIECGFSPQEGASAVRDAFAHGTRFSVVAAPSDPAAFGAIESLKEAGYRVPDDVSVIGFGGQTAYRQFFSPPLSTVFQDFDLLVKSAVDMLTDLIEKPVTHRPKHLKIRPVLLPGGTAAALPSGGY
jgi:DNA-binding LacI/PurR family transcriptional regulator